MSLLPFVVVTLGGAFAATLLRDRARLALAIGLAALAIAVPAALLIDPGEQLIIGASQLEMTWFLRIFLALGAFTGLLTAVVALATEWRPDVPAALLTGLGSLGVALALGDPMNAMLVLLIGATAITVLTVARPAKIRDIRVAARELRAVVVAGALVIAGIAWLERPIGAPPAGAAVFGLAFLAVAIGTALRFGAIPFHRWAARLAEVEPETSLPLLLAWAPAGFAIVALAWMDRSVAPYLLPLGIERGLVVAVAALTIVLGAVAAWNQDDLEHVLAYSVLQDAGFIILGLSILDPSAWQPTRAWILIFVVVKTAFASWAIAVRSRFGTRRIPELGGWARRAPGLAVALLLIVIATIGVPGLRSWDVRASLVDLAVEDGPLKILVLLGGLASLAYYGRIAAAGIAAPSAVVAAAPGGRLHLPARPGRRRASEEVAPAISAVGPAPSPGPTDETDDVAGHLDDPSETGADAGVEDSRGAAGVAGPRTGGRPAVIDRAGIAWRLNRAPIATTGVLALALVALIVGAGGLGTRTAAAAPAPDPGAPTETFIPGAAEPSPGLEASPGSEPSPGVDTSPGEPSPAVEPSPGEPSPVASDAPIESPDVTPSTAP